MHVVVELAVGDPLDTQRVDDQPHELDVLAQRRQNLGDPLLKLLDRRLARALQAVDARGELVERSRGPERSRPSRAHFEMHVGEILPALRGNREFLQLLMDTLKVERPAYRELHEYMTAQGWTAPKV